MEKFIGRESEAGLLKKIAKSGEAELVAVYGRRRVGKTFLIHAVYQRQVAFEFCGMHDATLSQQLENFSQSLTVASGNLPIAKPSGWIQAFKMLADYLTPIIKRRRKIVFFDEFPWMDTPRSGFLAAFENFWNTWASHQEHLVVVICGSSASWMIRKVINNKGGLYNRVTRKIRLLPFTIGETEKYLKSRGIRLDRYQVLQLYMVMGGIPQYLKGIEKGESAAQAIDRICFTKDGFLNKEFSNLFHSLFDNARYHVEVIRTLAGKKSGLTRSEIIENCKLTSGGGTTQVLEELTESGFIAPYIPFDRRVKDCIYYLTDEYSHFYIKFMENSKVQGPGTWIRFSAGSSWKSWSGYAFERVCMKHVLQIKKELGIENVYTGISVWRYNPQPGEQGAQVDLLIDRQDQCINLCEMKFSEKEFELTKNYAKELARKTDVFRDRSKTRKTIFLTMLTTHGVKNSEAYPGLVQCEMTMEALFRG